MKDGVIEQIDTPANIILNPATEYIAKFTRGVRRERVLSCQSIMEKHDASIDLSDITVAKDAVIDTIAEHVLSEQKPVAVVDEQGKIVGVVNKTSIIQIMFGKTHHPLANNITANNTAESQA